MIISTKGRYTLEVLIDLAEHADEGYIPLKEITERQKISLKYLESIMTVLSKAGLVDGVHGRGGGYRLNRSASEYYLGEILRLTEGNLAPVSCVGDNAAPCTKASDCRTLPIWSGLNNVINEYLDKITLADIISHAKLDAERPE